MIDGGWWWGLTVDSFEVVVWSFYGVDSPSDMWRYCEAQ
jgi:hypothetical protein